MGEEKKPEEKKVEEKKEEEKKPEEKKEKKEEEKKEADGEKKEEKKEPPPPEEFVYKVFMHCEGCAKKVKRSLKGFEGVEDVVTDCKSHTVVVKGKTADPLKVLERIQRKSHRKVELLTPLPPKPPAEEPKKEEKEKPKPEEKKEEPPVIVVVLKVHMHCEACAQEIRRRIQKMKGVQSVDPDLKSSQVTVKGVFDPPKLVEYIYKRTSKQAVIIKQEPEKKEEEKPKEEKKSENAEKGGDAEKPKKEGEEAKGEEVPKAEVTKNEFFYYYPKYATEYIYQPAEYVYPHPQLFSDENPNACSVM
eukprot:TRINITY_DN21107_c1_g1_i2.p2 TRINITY_DN21107_c1_g1~~TRINITY_DN21107_c1_g1_i2.p2  ORF type:complete len:304 (+),score=105.68 TRINITY_DN21107_c1_g1_i2:222-1133(+)